MTIEHSADTQRNVTRPRSPPPQRNVARPPSPPPQRNAARPPIEASVPRAQARIEAAGFRCERNTNF
jgi:hypothetical protein